MLTSHMQEPESGSVVLNHRIFERVRSRMTDENENTIQRAVCVWSPRHPPPVDDKSIAIFPAKGYMAFSAKIGRHRLNASLSVHTGEVRIGIVVPAEFAHATRDMLMDPIRGEQPTRQLDFAEQGVLFDWFLSTGACSAETMLAAITNDVIADAVADYIAHRVHNTYFAVLEVLSARCGVAYTAAGAYGREDLNRLFITVRGPEQPQRVMDSVNHLFGIMAYTCEEDGDWCYVIAAPKSEQDIPGRFAEIIGPDYVVKSYGTQDSASNGFI